MVTHYDIQYLINVSVWIVEPWKKIGCKSRVGGYAECQQSPSSVNKETPKNPTQTNRSNINLVATGTRATKKKQNRFAEATRKGGDMKTSKMLDEKQSRVKWPCIRAGPETRIWSISSGYFEAESRESDDTTTLASCLRPHAARRTTLARPHARTPTPDVF